MNPQFVLLGLSMFVTVLLIVVIWQMFTTWRARAVLAREGEYRRLVEQSVAAQEGAQRHLGEINAQLTELQARIASLERVLTTVE